LGSEKNRFEHRLKLSDADGYIDLLWKEQSWLNEEVVARTLIGGSTGYDYNTD
jgi:hypothetical protein